MPWKEAVSARAPCQVVGGCYHAFKRTGPARAHPTHSLPCKPHPSSHCKAQGRYSRGDRARSREGGRSQPAEGRGLPALHHLPPPTPLLFELVAMVQLSTSWCRGTSRWLGRKPPSLQGC